MAIELIVETPILKGEKGDKGDTGSFDYTYLEEIVDEHLDNRFEDVNASLDLKVDKELGKSLVDDDYIAKLDKLETLDKTVVEKFNDKVEQSDLEENLIQIEGQLQNYIDGKLVTAGSGDMLKRIYDTDDDGIVDKAENANNADKVNNLTVETAVPPNAFDEVTTSKNGLMGYLDKIKLNGIESGANYTQIIDNLTTNSSDKALSALQGMVIDERLKEIENIKRTQLFKGSILNGTITLSDKITNYRFLMIGFNTSDMQAINSSVAIFPVLFGSISYQDFSSIREVVPSEKRTIVSYVGTLQYLNETTLSIYRPITNLYHISEGTHSGVTQYAVKEIWGVR